MHEIFPVAAGAVLGLAVQGIRSTTLRWLALIAVALAIGATASMISGEVELSLGFIPVDVVQALVAALLVRGLVAVWERRPIQR